MFWYFDADLTVPPRKNLTREIKKINTMQEMNMPDKLRDIPEMTNLTTDMWELRI